MQGGGCYGNPPYIPYTKVSMPTGRSLVTLGCPRTHSTARCRADARMFQDTAGAVLSLTHHLPLGAASRARCGVAMETARGQVAEDKWGDVRVSRKRLKRLVLFPQTGVSVSHALTLTLDVCHALMRLQERKHTHDGCRSTGQLGHSIIRSPVWHVPCSHATESAKH